MPGNGHSAYVSNGPNGPARQPQPQRPRGGKVSKYEMGVGFEQPTQLSWNDVNGAIIADTVAAVTAAGDAIMFAMTSDGGAFSISVSSGGQRFKQWPSSVEACETVLTQIMQSAQTG